MNHFVQPDQLLVQGVWSGHLRWVEAALAAGANVHYQLPSNTPELPNGSLLALAAGLDHVHLVPVLLSAGVHVDYGGGFGYTPLQVAVHQGNDKMVDVLLKVQPEGPDVNAKDKDGTSSNIYILQAFPLARNAVIVQLHSFSYTQGILTFFSLVTDIVFQV